MHGEMSEILDNNSESCKHGGPKLEYTFKNGLLFKMLFLEYPHLLEKLAAALLGIPLESISSFQITSNELKMKEIGEKFCKLDSSMMLDNKRVNLEIQLESEGNYPERALFHFARIYLSSLPIGDDCSVPPRTIIISIVDFLLFDCEETHSEFKVMEVKRHIPLTDKCELHFFELPKMDNLIPSNMSCERDLWLALLNAETERELDELVAGGGAVLSEAIQALRTVADSEEFRNLESLRTKASLDEAQALINLRKQRDEHWQGVVAEKDQVITNQATENAKLRAQLEDLHFQLHNSNQYAP